MNQSPIQIGPYTIEAEIGRGGMGVVFRALDSRLGRMVALKSLHNQATANPENIARFEREARALAALNHPNIAGIHGLEQEAGRHFLVLEYVPGETLAERLGRGPLSVAEALDICTQIITGLEAAHQAGVVHRDLKPANVKITPDGTVKILDFGLARMDDQATTHHPSDETQEIGAGVLATTEGTLLGTVPYMSPEQARGEAVDKRSDIWSFAVILWECLTGLNPFAGPTATDCMATILTAEIDLGTLPADTPPLASHLLRRSLQRDLRSRLRDTGDMRMLLEDCLAEKSDEAAVAPVITEVVHKSFLIDDKICRTLDKDGFDPHLIGWQMQYADNQRPSSILQFWIPSFGEDHSMGIWRDLLASAPHRTIVATPVGLEPNASHRPIISMENQLVLLRHLVSEISDQARPEKVVVGGFS